MNYIEIKDLLEDREYGLKLKLAAGEKGLKNKITSVLVQKLGLALTGIDVPVYPNRIQLMGRPEIKYLMTLDDNERKKIIHNLFALKVACIVITRSMRIPAQLEAEANKRNIPLLRTKHPSSDFVTQVTNYLEERLSPRISIHGVLLDVLGIGILLLGRSGIGKSECALDLIQRGHRLVADDVVEIQRKPPKTIFGKGSEIIKHHMEIRGLGIINIRDLFGVAATRDRKKIELVIELVEWEHGREYERLGIDVDKYEVIGVDLPHLTLPVLPGKNLSTIIEVAARNHLLKLGGHHSARQFQKKLLMEIASNRKKIRIFGDDIE